MSIKSLIQILILLLIFSIIGGVYYKYFDTKKDIVEETNFSEIVNQDKINELERKIIELELKNNKLIGELSNNKEEEKKTPIENKNITYENIEIKDDEKKQNKKTNFEKKKISTKEIKNLVKDVEYTSIDEKGNKFYLLANSGKSNANNNDILDLSNVRGEISSDKRDTIYIVSDYGQYNSVNSNSKFFKNVIINYQEKQITCENFDINMETSKAIAYTNVVITDPKSKMKAGIVEFDLKTKDININPETASAEIKVVTE